MAKSKSARASVSSADKSVNNHQLVQQWRAVRAEISKVTWPTREEAQKLTTAVTIGMVVMAIFLYGVDAIFQFLILDGILKLNLIWIVVTVIIGALLTYAFFTNSQEE